MTNIRCIICGKEFKDEKIPENSECCPNCGTETIPCDINDDINIKINWHELRILTIWAENWARHLDQNKSQDDEKNLLTILTIAQRLQKQFPKKLPLTLFGEIKELRNALGDESIVTDLDDDNLLGLGKL